MTAVLLLYCEEQSRKEVGEFYIISDACFLLAIHNVVPIIRYNRLIPPKLLAANDYSTLVLMCK